MKYSLFNPVTGLHTVVEGNASAVQERNRLINEAATNYGQNVEIFKSQIVNEKNIARAFVANKHGSSYDYDPLYMYSAYKLDTQSRLFAMYIFGRNRDTNPIAWEIKVTDGAVTEQYQNGPYISATEYTLQGNDLETNEPIEYYWTIDKDMNKIPFNSPDFYALAKFDMQGNMLPGISIERITFADLPQDKQALLENFEYKDKITGYKFHPIHGFLVYYREDLLQAPTQEQMDAAAQEYVAEWSDKFTVCEVTEHESGDATWNVIDPSTLTS